MSRMPRDIHNRSIPAFFPETGGTQQVAVNSDSPTNAPVSIDILNATQHLPDVPVITALLSDIDVRIAVVDADNSGFATDDDMSAEFVLLANTYLYVPSLYPSRATVYVCALSTANAGTLYAMRTADN